MNKPMLIIILLFAGLAVLDLVIELLNLRSWATTLPAEFNGYYDNARYGIAQKYLADKTVSGLVKEITLIALIMLFIVLGGFNLLDAAARGFLSGPVGRGLVFAGILFALLFLISLPFDIIKSILISLLVSAVGFYLFSRLANQPVLFQAFGVQHASIYAALICFSILIIPIQRVGSVGSSWLSRSFEYTADRYALKASHNPEALISALKKISADSLANLQPHPVKVFFDYSHPPILQRIKELRDDQQLN